MILSSRNIKIIIPFSFSFHVYKCYDGMRVVRVVRLIVDSALYFVSRLHLEGFDIKCIAPSMTAR